MGKYIEKLLGVYGEDGEKLRSHLLKREIPSQAILTFATVAISFSRFDYLALFAIYPAAYCAARTIAHLEKLDKYPVETEKFESLSKGNQYFSGVINDA